MDKLIIDATKSQEISLEMFGVKLGRENGPDKVDAYTSAFDYLGVKAVRFSYDVDVGLYNLGDKNITTADALSYAANRGDGVTLCIVTKSLFKSDLDSNILTPRDVDMEKIAEIKEQITRLLSSSAMMNEGNGVKVLNAIELGNEYWGLGGMTSQEYGKLVNILAKAVGEAIENSGISAALAPKVLVQMGSPYSAEFNSGEVNSPYKDFSWSDAIRQANQDIIDQIVDIDAKSTITGLVEHYYYTQVADSFSFDSAAVRFIDRDWSVWAANGYGDRDLYITEWNNKLNNPAQFGLKGSGVMIEMFENMLKLGVDAATIWPFQHNESRLVDTLKLNSDGIPQLTPRGAAFKLMSESLVGANLLDSSIDTSSGFEYEVNAFSNGDEYILFLFSRADHDLDVSIDLSSQTKIGTVISGVTIGVDALSADGKYSDAGRELSVPVYQDPDALATLTNTTYVYGASGLEIDLAPYEIIRLTFTSVGPIIRLGTDLAESFRGGNGDDSIMGCGGSDDIITLGGADEVSGGSGRDKINLGTGNDSSDGGTGDDFIVGDLGNDRLIGGYGADTLFGDSGDDTVQGGRGRDDIKGGSGTDLLYGGHEDDTLLGDDGRDTLDGGFGADYLNGGSGDDTLIIDNGFDRANGAGGVDRVVSSSVSLNLSSGKFRGVENASLEGNAHLKLTGNLGANNLTGNSGNNYIFAGGGNDTLVGGKGNDTLWGGAGQDVFVFNTALGAKNVDRICDFDTRYDTFKLYGGVVTDVAPGALGVRNFSANLRGQALDAHDRVIYETDTGFLYFDQDGIGGAERQLVAALAPQLHLTASNFFIY